MKLLNLNVLFGALLGLVLAISGFHIATWQYWVILLIYLFKPET